MYRYTSNSLFTSSVNAYKKSSYPSLLGWNRLQVNNVRRTWIENAHGPTAKLSRFLHQISSKKFDNLYFSNQIHPLVNSERQQRWQSSGRDQKVKPPPSRIKLFGSAIIVGVTAGSGKHYKVCRTINPWYILDFDPIPVGSVSHTLYNFYLISVQVLLYSAHICSLCVLARPKKTQQTFFQEISIKTTWQYNGRWYGRHCKGTIFT